MSSASSDIEQPVPICPCACCDDEPQDYGIEAEGTVRAATGQLTPVIGENDIPVPGFDFDLGVTRSYNNRSSEDVGFGPGWTVAELPWLVEDGSTVMIEGASNDTLYFDEQSGGTFVAKYYILHKLKLVAGSGSGDGEYVLTAPDGSQKVFAESDGSLIAIRDPFGHEASVVYDSGGDLESIGYSTGASGQSIEYQFAWSGGHVASITLLVDAAEARRVTYGYTGSGGSGDLESVTVEDKGDFFSGWKTVRQTYYRYDGNGLLKYVLKDQAYKQAASAGSGWPEGASDAQLDDYADYRITYGAHDRVSQLKTKGGKYTYSFTYEDSAFADGVNNWKRKTVVTQPDSSVHRLYFNYVAQLMLREVDDSTNNWYLYQKFYPDNRVLWMAESSAVDSVDEGTAILVSLKDTSGLIHEYEYTAEGYLKTESLKNGTSDTAVKLRLLLYDGHTVGNVTIQVVSQVDVYQRDHPTEPDPSTTEYSYEWWQNGAIDTFQVRKRVTTLPVVIPGHHGNGADDTEETHYDEFGFVTKQVDARGAATTYEYDGPTAAVIKMTQDAGTDTSSHDYLNLVTDYQVDNLGRVTEELGPVHTIDLNSSATAIRRARWIYYKDDVDERWEINGYVKTSGPTQHTINPVMIQKFDVDDGSGGRRTEQIAAVYSNAANSIPPDDHNFQQSSYVRWSTMHYDKGGEMTHSREYYDIGNLDYNQTDYGYDTMGRQDEVITPGGTIQFTIFNAMGWVTNRQVGTEPDSGPSNLVDVLENEYTGNAGADGMVTREIYPVEAAASGSIADRVVTSRYDWRNRLEEVELSATSPTQTLITKYVYDNRSLVTSTLQYHTSVSAGNLFAERETSYDSRGRLYQDKIYGINSSGSQESSIQTDNYYDEVGNLIRQVPAGTHSRVTVNEYDVLRRMTQTAIGYEDPSSIADPGTLDDVVVMEHTNLTYDDASNVIKSVQKVRFDDATTGLTGELEDFDTQPKARIYYSGRYPDPLGRTQAEVNVGTNAGIDSSGGPVEWSRPTTIPNRSDTALVTSTEYDNSGEVESVADPEDTITRFEYDDAGRRIKLIENYQGAESSAVTTDRVTRYEYNSDSNLQKLISENADTPPGEQVTEWVYGVSTPNSNLNSNLLVAQKIYPTNTSKKDLYQYNRQGQVIQMTDQNETVHDYSYDGMGRLIEDEADPGDGVDATVTKISRTYNERGLLEKVTSANGSNVVVNDVEFSYNDFLQVSTEAQEHGTTVGTSTPEVAYEYADGTNNTIRPTKVTYPGGEEVLLEYTSTANDRLSRLEEMVRGPAGSSEQTLSSYRYLGLNTVVGIEYGTSTAVEFTYENGGAGDAGDKYTGLDRFGRVVQNHWKTSISTLQYTNYGYDRASNRVWRENVEAGGANSQDNYYQYDGLYQLTNWKRGALDKDSAGNPTGMTNPADEQQFDYDETGNWKRFEVGVGSMPDLDQTRTHNRANQITDITNVTGPSPAVDPTYDANGNTKQCPSPADWTTAQSLTWDAWNRLVEVDETGGGTHSYVYDGLNRRVSKSDGTTARDFYYNDRWQIVEEQVSGSAKVLNFWGVRDLNDLVMRDRPDDEGEIFMLKDDLNVVASTDNSGVVQSRISYDVFGNATFLTPSWGDSSSSDEGNVDELCNLFHGHYCDDETGLYQMRFRFYHPQLGKWLSRDPIGTFGGLNLYTFVDNNPVKWTDVLGLVQNPGSNCLGYALSGRRGFNVQPASGQSAQDYVEQMSGIKCREIRQSADCTCGPDYDTILIVFITPQHYRGNPWSDPQRWGDIEGMDLHAMRKGCRDRGWSHIVGVQPGFGLVERADPGFYDGKRLKMVCCCRPCPQAIKEHLNRIQRILDEERQRLLRGGATSYGATSYGATSYGATSYGATSYGATSYGATSYGATSYGGIKYGTWRYGAARQDEKGYGAGYCSSKISCG